MTAPRCQACDSGGLEAFYEVRGVPVHSCLLLDDREQAAGFPTRDLVLAFCRACGLVQNIVFDPSAVDYSADYEDSQAHSPKFVAFATELAEHLVGRYGLRGGTVLEIGCGKGDFLAILSQVGDMRGVGVDPAYRPGPLVEAAGDRLRFLTERYDAEHGDQGAGLVVCRHTLEHVPDVRAFMDRLRAGLAGSDDPVVFFEVPDVLRVLDEVAFWDIYYEHCSYFSRGSLARLFRRSGFEPLDARLGYDGQYVLLEAALGARRAASALAGEEDLDRLAGAVQAFSERAPRRIEKLRAELDAFAERGPVVAWGAGSKAVGYLTTLGVADEVAAVVDINPTKHGRHLAGTGHAIIGPPGLRRLGPAVVVVMNPIYVQEVSRDLKALDIDAEVVAL
jgi:SAM-dependent methyltransferase